MLHVIMSENPLWIFNFSGWSVSHESLNEVAELSGVLEEGNDYLMPDTKEECERIIPEVENVKPKDAAVITHLFSKCL